MSVMVLIEVPVKPEDVSNMKSYLGELLPVAQKHDGCEGIDVYFNAADAGNMVLVEHWESRAHHEKYVAWSTQSGTMEKLGGMFAGPPEIRYFERADLQR